LGAKIPPQEEMKKGKTPENAGGTKPSTPEETKKSYEEEQQEEEPEVELPQPELDNSGVVEDKTGNEEYPMGDPNKEVSEEDMEKANENRDIAAAAFSECLRIIKRNI
jgi:hypothetical protein